MQTIVQMYMEKRSLYVRDIHPDVGGDELERIHQEVVNRKPTTPGVYTHRFAPEGGKGGDWMEATVREHEQPALMGVKPGYEDEVDNMSDEELVARYTEMKYPGTLAKLKKRNVVVKQKTK